MNFKTFLVRLKRPYVKFTYFLARRKRLEEAELKMKSPKELLEKRDKLYKRYLEADKNDRRTTEAVELVAQIRVVDWVIGKVATLCLMFCLLCSVAGALQKVSVESAHFIVNGQTTTNAGSAVQLNTTSTAISSVSVKALSTNTGVVYVGDSSVDNTNGRELQAGESVDIDISNLNKVYIDVSVNGEGVSYAAVR